MRSRFDEQLASLHSGLIETGALCEQAIALAAKALEGEKELAEKVFPLHGEIDRRERETEELCLKMLLRQQPVAGDLRLISAALKMVTDMERIGDIAADMADIIVNMSYGAACAHISEMAGVAVHMVSESVDAFVRRDTALAQKVIADDDTVDALFLETRTELIGMIESKKTDGERAIDLLMIAKYFEKIGDHAESIASWVEFSTGAKTEEKL